MFHPFTWTYIDKNDWYGMWGGTRQRPHKMPTRGWSVEMSGPMSYFTARSRKMSGSLSRTNQTISYTFQHGRCQSGLLFRSIPVRGR